MPSNQAETDARSNADLATAAAGRDREAFAELVVRHRHLVRSVLRGYTRRDWELDDLLQETWLQAWLSLPQMRDASRVSAWLQGLAVNVGRRWRRIEQQRAAGVVRALGPTAMESIGETGGNGAGSSVAATPGFRRLSVRQQTLLRLKYDQELSYAEIAQVEGTSASAVQSALHRARLRLNVAATPARPKETGMSEVQIESIHSMTWTDEDGADTGGAAVEFRGSDAATDVWIVWGQAEADAAMVSLKSREPPRPLTHDLAQSLIESLGGRLRGVEINRLVESTFFATLRLEQDDRMVDVDARPSDAVNLALRAGVPVAVTDDVVAAARRQRELFPFPPQIGHEYAGKTLSAVERIWPATEDGA